MPNVMNLEQEKTPEEILNELLAQVRAIHRGHSNLSEIAERYLAEKSHIDTILSWYGSIPWWGKTGLGLAVLGLGVGLGFLFAMPLIVGGVTAALHLLITYFLENHVNVMHQRNTRFRDEMRAMDETFNASVDSLRLLEEQLNAVLQSLCHLHIQQAENITEFKGKVERVEEQNLHYTDVLQGLKEAADSLFEQSTRFASNEATLTSVCEAIQAIAEEIKSHHVVLLDLVIKLEAQLKEDDVLRQEAQEEMPVVSVSPRCEPPIDLESVESELEDFEHRHQKQVAAHTSIASHKVLDDFDQAFRLLEADERRRHQNPLTKPPTFHVHMTQ